MPEQLPVRRVEVSFAGAAPAQQVARRSGVSEVEIDGSRTGSTITSAGLVRAGTFGVSAVVEAGQPGGSIYRDILASLAIGILMDAFLVRTLLVPSTVALLGRWNWWPSTHGQPAGATPDPELALVTPG